MERDHELEKQIAVLEERMNTHEARIDSTLNALRADQNALRTDLERFNTDAAKRSHAQTKWIIGAFVAAGGILIAVAGLIFPLLISTS